MTGRQRRLALVVASLAALGVALALVLSAFRDNLVFFFTPSQVIAGEAPRSASLRIGGMVEVGSVQRQADGVTVMFAVTDNAHAVRVRYRGALPDLFREGKGVVAQGRLAADKVFVADQVLAKHDENYMPPEAAYAMKKASARPASAPGAAP